ncbi:MAG: hypothetical protein JNL56_07030 [Alphaproteobacteria bacterium]|nr:hypothetical protein [Alphaproteobacteria bacterium]
MSALAAGAARALPAGKPVLAVEDVEALSTLEANGYALGDTLQATGAASTADLAARSAPFRILAEAISADTAELRDLMAENGRPLREVTAENIGRVMDLRWLSSPLARFRLVGVINRIDKRDFGQSEGTCGEVRLIYRLAYRFAGSKKGRLYSSRLPVSINVVFEQTGDCRDAAGAWVPPKGAPETAAWLKAGPLARERLRLKQVELNVQIVRFPSGLETEFGGQAVYLMRVFGASRAGGALTLFPKPLENTPDVPKLEADPALRAEMVAYLRDHAADVDEGTLVLPDRFLSTKALSYSTYGPLRTANRPFSALLKPEAFDGTAAAGFRLLKSTRGMLERLDQMSCMGCHQSNGTAGFHFFGLDDAETSPLNRVTIGHSPHFAAELPRRAAYVAALLEGKVPDRFRPLPNAPPADWHGAEPVYEAARPGMACIPSEAAADLSDWNCDATTVCTAVAANARLGLVMGQCLRPTDEGAYSGQLCLAGEIEDGDHPFNDTFRIGDTLNSFATTVNAKTHACRPPKLGVPGGASYRQCTEGERNFDNFAKGARPDEVCALAGGKQFDLCVASGDFASCIDKAVVRGNRQTCGGDRYCRDDFMCQALPPNLKNVSRIAGSGYCSPTYFLFQMRIDNHPDPVKGL